MSNLHYLALQVQHNIMWLPPDHELVLKQLDFGWEIVSNSTKTTIHGAQQITVLARVIAGMDRDGMPIFTSFIKRN